MEVKQIWVDDWGHTVNITIDGGSVVRLLKKKLCHVKLDIGSAKYLYNELRRLFEGGKIDRQGPARSASK